MATPASKPPAPDSGSPPQPSVSFALDLRRPLIIVAAVGVVALVVTFFLQHILFGVLVCVGLACGLLNIRLVQRSVSRVTAKAHPSKQAMALSSMSRLAVITVIALVIGFLLRPDGIGLFFGLAVFQVIWVACTTVPVVKGLRQQ